MPISSRPPSTASEARSFASSVLWVRLPAGSSCLRSTQCDSSSSPPAAASTTSDHALGIHRPFSGPRYALLGRCSVTGSVHTPSLFFASGFTYLERYRRHAPVDSNPRMTADPFPELRAADDLADTGRFTVIPVPDEAGLAGQVRLVVEKAT